MPIQAEKMPIHFGIVTFIVLEKECGRNILYTKKIVTVDLLQCYQLRIIANLSFGKMNRINL